MKTMTESEVMAKYLHEFPSPGIPPFCNVMRNDSRPGCYFEHYKGFLRLVDRGDPLFFNATWADIVMIAHHGRRSNTPEDMKHALRLLGVDRVIREGGTYKPKKFEMQLSYKRDVWRQWHYDYLVQRGISLEQALADEMYPVAEYTFNSKNGCFYTVAPVSPTFCYELNGKLKIYAPTETEGYKKWKTDFDRGCIKTFKGDSVLIITEGIKDAQVARNASAHTFKALSSVGTFPEKEIIRSWLKYDAIYTLFDLDEGGETGAKALIDYAWETGVEIKQARLPASLLQIEPKWDIDKVRVRYGHRGLLKALKVAIV